MAKGKNKATIVAAPPKCTCDDPYKCDCGNRPERPSRGHKWYPEDQIWAGKGHKQKGASGQTALVSEQAKVTATGKTQVAQWQRLPTQLLQEFCKNQKRPNPSFKNIGTNGQYRYRCIVHDQKRDSDKDLFFVPSQAVSNEEQAQEESALLALLQLTPTLPHERKLPDPYKTTWLNAVKTVKQGSKAAPVKTNGGVAASVAKNVNSKDDDTKERLAATNNASEGAVASTSLTLSTTYISNADKRQKMAEMRRIQNARIRKHENIRQANQNHPVFMSVVIRKQIESLLRGDMSNIPNLEAESDEDEEDNDDDRDDAAEDNAVKMYVTHRLYSEGFSKRQAKSAFEQTTNNISIGLDMDNEASWDRVYEECLQWLLVHLNEDQLPEGFDPRGRTLDVVLPVGNIATKSIPTTIINENGATINFATQYGITIQEASLILDQANKDNQSPEEVFWRTINAAAGIRNDDCIGTNSEVSNLENEIFNEEMEALLSIFDSNFNLMNEECGHCRIRVEIAGGYHLNVAIVKDMYPNEKPKFVSVDGPWQSKVGVKLHIELAKFISDLPLGDVMIFAIHGHAQDVIQSEELVTMSLLPYLVIQDKVPSSEIRASSVEVKPNPIAKSTINVAAQHIHRPRSMKKSFWTTHPRDTAPALGSPKVSPMMERTRKSLPAFQSRNIFLDAMKEAERKGSRVVLVTGETGSGKSTQIPAYILEDDPIGSKIVVVQPRRIAATGVANRVAEERGEQQAGSGSVGYVVRGDSALCSQSRLVFCTTGVLLRQFQVEGALDCLTTIVIDEVHERNLDGDILLGLLKRILPTKPHLRVVLMSATLATDSFKTYWGNTYVPHVHIPGRTFPVTDFFLEDVLRITGFVPSKKKKGNKSKNMMWLDVENNNEAKDIDMIDDTEPKEPTEVPAQHRIPIDELVGRVDETSPDPDIICRLLKHIILSKDPSDDGSILVFLAGAPEIKNLELAIKNQLVGVPITVLPLHGGLQAKEQGRVFQPAQTGNTKIVLSTNVAETSVTIPDCTVVLDTGREKQASYDPVNRMPLLIEQFASKASMKQRRGRAGRVREGTCYKLISRRTFASLQEHSAPEIHRVALDQTLLQLLFLGVEDGLWAFTNSLMDPPTRESLDAATFSLSKLGAIENRCKDGTSTLTITPLGSHLAGIPAPPVVGKILVMGSILGCRSAALSMAAGISLGRSIFLRLDNVRNKAGDSAFEEAKQEKVLAQRKVLAKEAGHSDHALLAYTFLKWQSTESGLRSRYCDSLGVSSNSLRDMAQLYTQLNNSLIEAGFYATPESDRYSSSWRIIQTCAVSGMAPSQLVKVRRPATRYHETAEGSKEVDGVAKEFSFYIRGESGKEERVFIHPSSINFSTGNYGCPFLVFNSMVRTSKPFLRDVTECNAYALLLFGGELQIEAAKGIVTIANWAELSANARIGSLIGGLRKRIDALLAEKIVNPTIDVSSLPEIKLVIKLVRTQGLGS